MSAAGPLHALAEQLRAAGTVISPHVIEPAGEPVLGPLASRGPRAAADPEAYALIVESIREGYELHYGAPRVLSGHDEDLALLAGDYLYAIGLERLAGLGDGEAVAELSDLISLSAACHAEGAEATVASLWLSSVVAVGCGRSPEHERAKARARAGDPEAATALLQSARAAAAAAGLEGDLDQVAESIDFAAPGPADSG